MDHYGRLTVIMAPELEPVTKTFLGSALYFLRAYETMLAMALLSPPPLCFKDFCEETSQQVPLWFDYQHIYMIRVLYYSRGEKKGR